MASHAAPIIIKRKRVIQAAGHHGGAWKVAYADFVTAMMAFFLLMWLLGATTEDQRKGIADYFNTTIPISATTGGGVDALNGDSVLTEEQLARSGEFTAPHNRRAVIPESEALREEIQKLARNAGIEDAEDRIIVRKTDEGTVIELVDTAGDPLFASGSAEPSEGLKVLINSAINAIQSSGADVKVTGHTDGYLFTTDDYTNWELSADRANTARRLLLAGGISLDRIVEVAGRADRDPIGKDHQDPANRRIAIILKDPREQAVAPLR